MATILVIEDESVLARNIVLSLRRSGYLVLHCASADEARLLLSTRRFDLVIADITLGDGDGIEVIQEFDQVMTKIPVIVITGQDSVVNRTRANEFYVSVFLAKPFALSRLRELVGALLEESSQPGADNVANSPSVVMYSHDTIGLGHMRRNLAIARELVKIVPRISVLLLVGCPAGMMFDTEPGIDYVKLPSMTKLGRNHYKPGSLRLDSSTTRAVRAGIIERVLSTVSPDIFLVDHEPLGVGDELLPALNMLKQDHSTTVVLGLRDILDDPVQVRARWLSSGISARINDLYDHLLIYGNRTFFDSQRHYDLDSLNLGGSVYCGVVSSAKPEIRTQTKDRPEHIVVSGGGGRDAFPLYDAALSAYTQLDSRIRPMLTLVAGPLIDAELCDVVRKRASELNVLFHESVSDYPALLKNADLMISMAGYNSTNESLVMGCPLVVVPRVGPSSEQRMRAERLEALNLARVIYREDLKPESLQHLMVTKAPSPSPSILSMLDFNGAVNAAKHITRMIEPSFMESESYESGGHARVIAT